MSAKSQRLREILRFAINGGISFAVDYGVLFVLTEYARFHYFFSAAISFTLSVLVNYYICKLWVFDISGRQTTKAKIFFFGSSVIGLGLNQLFMWLFIEIAHIHYMLAKVIVTGVVMVWNYIMKRRALHADFAGKSGEQP